MFEKDFDSDFHYPYDGDIELFVNELRNDIEPEVPPINKYNFKFAKNPAYKCNNVSLRLLYLVKSAPSHFDRRIAIRSTWGFEQRFSDVNIRTVFLIGEHHEDFQEALRHENEKFKDIVQANFTDHYFNNTYKTMSGITWAMDYCLDSRYYMFVDDDYYVSTKNVLRFLRHPTRYPLYLKGPIILRGDRSMRKPLNYFDLKNDVVLFTGYVFKSAPHRHFLSKFHVSLDEYPYHMWPPYVTAGAFILSKEALINMYYASFYTKHFRFDDVYLGLVAMKAKIEPFHHEDFHFYKKPYDSKSYEYTIASHGYGDGEELLQIWTKQRSLGNA